MQCNNRNKIKIVYLDSVNKFKEFNNVHNFIFDIDKLFEPPLSERVDLLEYTKKIINEAHIILAYPLDSKKIEGIAAFYCNPLEYRYAFLSLIASRFKLRGIGGIILEETIKYCKGIGMIGIETQTWERNEKSQALFYKYGFKFIKYIDNRGDSNNRSVYLRLTFFE